MKAAIPVVLALLAALPARAHRLDECLQGAFVSVETNRVGVELDLTPGIAVADAVLGLADADHDGVVSPAEQAAFASAVLRSLDLELDATPLRPAVVGSSFPDAASLRTGTAVVQLEYEAVVPPLAPGRHRVVWRNRWAPVKSVHLANALVPRSPSVRVVSQRRDLLQAELAVEVEVAVPAARTAVRTAPGPARTPVWAGLAVLAAAAAAGAAVLWAARRRRRA